MADAFRQIAEGLYHQAGGNRVICCQVCHAEVEGNYAFLPEKSWCRGCGHWVPVYHPGCQWHPETRDSLEDWRRYQPPQEFY
jgi:hypothetical protein